MQGKRKQRVVESKLFIKKLPRENSHTCFSVTKVFGVSYHTLRIDALFKANQSLLLNCHKFIDSPSLQGDPNLMTCVASTTACNLRLKPFYSVLKDGAKGGQPTAQRLFCPALQAHFKEDYHTTTFL